MLRSPIIKKLLSSFLESAVIWNFFQFSLFSVVFLGIVDSNSAKNNEKRLKLETLLYFLGVTSQNAAIFRQSFAIFQVHFIRWRWCDRKKSKSTFYHCNIPADFKNLIAFCRAPQKWSNYISILGFPKFKNNLRFNFWHLARIREVKKSKTAGSPKTQDVTRRSGHLLNFLSTSFYVLCAGEMLSHNYPDGKTLLIINLQQNSLSISCFTIGVYVGHKRRLF